MTKEEQLTEHIKMLSRMLERIIVANQSAWIEWTHGAGADAAMMWIHNGLDDPGNIPDMQDPNGQDAQAWYDANRPK